MDRRFWMFACVVSFFFACSLSSMNPFHKEKPVYSVYSPYSEPESARSESGLKGVDNVIYYMKRDFAPLEAEIVLNTYEGFIIDAGRASNVSVGDQFISEKGSILKVIEVRDKYCVALPSIGNPVVGEAVRKMSFRKVLFLDFTRSKGRKLYNAIKSSIKGVSLSEYDSGVKFRKKFVLKYPSDFKRKVPISKLTGYDGYFVVSDLRGLEVFDGTKRLVRIYPWEGVPMTSLAVARLGPARLLINFAAHATSMFVANIDKSVEEEIVLSMENSIKVFHFTVSGLRLVYTFPNPFKGSYIFHVCPVDIDGDGVFEIVVDGFYSDTKSVSSGIFKVSGGSLEKVASSSMIISAFDTDGDGVNESIYGQPVSPLEDKIFGEKVYLLEVSGNRLIPAREVKVPHDFQVTSAQVFVSGGRKYFVYYDLQYYLNVSDGTRVVWRSPIQIGASPNCLFWEVNDSLVSYYITPKPKPIDIDADGDEEVLFSQNKATVPHVLKNVLSFDGGRILMLYRSGTDFSWEEASGSFYGEGGIEEFVYLPDVDVFVSIFTTSSIIKNPKSKLFMMRTKI